MVANYKQVDIDFDSLFDPYVTGAKPAATGYAVAGVDLSDRYAPISFGSKRADVGAKVNGLDVSNLFAQIGSATYFPASITAQAASNTGLARSASITISYRTNGTIVVACVGVSGTTGAGTYNYVPTAVGASAPYDFRIRGTFVGVRNSSNTATGTGKGGVSYNAGLSPTGSTAAFDTGWIATADDAAAFLTISCVAPANAGAGTIECSGANRATLEVRRKSDGVVVFTTLVTLQCIADSQS